MYKALFKPLLDRLVAALVLLPVLPVVIVVLALLAWKQQGRVFFTQLRVGRHNHIFRLLKLKTMTDERGPDGELLADHMRLTSIGRFVRSTSLDELPQLINILKGEMSFVGPRPLLVEYLPLYSPEQARRHEVMPGITGWAQVNGRNAISWVRKLQLDTEYADKCSLMLDLKILWLTVYKVISRKDISAEGHVTTGKFQGEH